MKKTLILGIGNPLLSDDGIGPRIVQDLEGTLDSDVFDFFSVYVCDMDLINTIEGYENLVIIDGKITQTGKPGEITIYSDQNYDGMAHLDNYHDISFRDLVKLGRDIELNIPNIIHIVGIQIIEDKTFSEELSLPLQNSYKSIFQKIKVFTEDLVQDITTNLNHEAIR